MTEPPTRSDTLRDAVERAYAVFAAYPRPADAGFCTFCYSDATIAYLRATDLRAFDEEHVRRITWESADHWDSTELYKHYLPRIMDALAPPDRCDDLFPEHLFEVLNHHQFERWPPPERQAVIAWIRAVREALALDSADDAGEWEGAAAILRTGSGAD